MPRYVRTESRRTVVFAAFAGRNAYTPVKKLRKLERTFKQAPRVETDIDD